MLQVLSDELEAALDFPARTQALEAIGDALARMPPEERKRPVSEGVLRAVRRACSPTPGAVTGPFLIAAFRALPDTSTALTFVNDYVWRSAFPLRAKRTLYRYVAENTGSHRLRTALARMEDCRRDPEVRRILLRSRSQKVLEAFLRCRRTLSPAEFSALLGRIARQDPARAVEILNQHVQAGTHTKGFRGSRCERPLYVTADLVATLLEIGDPKHREGVLALLPHLMIADASS